MKRFVKDWYTDTIRSGENGDIENVLQNIGIYIVIVLFIYNTIALIMGL